jgi:hypothetical protein
LAKRYDFKRTSETLMETDECVLLFALWRSPA